MANTFLQLDGIDGESLDDEHLGEIEIHNWTWHMANDADPKVHKSDTAAKTTIDNITLFKRTDVATVALVQYCATGQIIESATLTCRKNAGEFQFEYLIIEFDNVVVHDIKFAGAEQGNDILGEEVQLEFSAFTIYYALQAQEGNVAPGSAEYHYDLTQNQSTPGAQNQGKSAA